MSTKNYNEMLSSSFLDGGNLAYIEDLYEQYLTNPQAVNESWRHYFAQLPASKTNEVALEPVRAHFLQLAKQPALTQVVVTGDAAQATKQAQVNALVDAYRTYGHRLVKTDPLNLLSIPTLAELQLSTYGLSDADLNTVFNTHGFAGLPTATLKQLIAALTETYCGDIASEFMYIADKNMRQWVQNQLETCCGKIQLTTAQKQHILEKLTAAEGLERYLGTKFVGQKRFSIEGADSMIPMIDELIQRASAQGVLEVTIGMSHRGRLNTLINILGKAPKDLFDQFAGKHHDEDISGDVKYHSGFSADVKTAQGEIHLALAFNPSHLEFVGPVVEGATYAKQQLHGENGIAKVLPLVIHGDAALAGQGINMEMLNFSQVPGYKTGGTVHLVVNNQVGFTTSQFEARSTLYCTDLAKMIDAPVFHVNGDNPEAALLAMQLAVDYRMKFKADIFIDLVCYRRHGHNEADEPVGTQPLMYRVIKSLPTTRALYAQRLIAEKVLTSDKEKTLQDNYRDKLDAGAPVVDLAPEQITAYDVDWSPYLRKSGSLTADTRIDMAELKKLAQAISTVPANITLQAQVVKVMDDRKKMAAGELPLDWGCAENLAYASLAVKKHNIRISGEDCQRGTFSHRHAVVRDVNTGASYCSLQHLSAEQGTVTILNSILSEEAVMAFDYGYSSAAPNDLTIWEAQFGDFANGAQVIIDQFIAPAEQKWHRLSGLTLLLPHGYEGQGPEHSSARLERYLQLCAQDNMSVCVPTTPAQIFHLLRRQMLRPVRKPLIVMTPKSLLRHKLATSTLEELSQGQFQLVIPEIDSLTDSKVTRVILCAGKVYYDLLQQRREAQRDDIAIIRVEQLYPFPTLALQAQLKRYSKAKDVVWCQEEPHNQGAWFCIRENLETVLEKTQSLRYVGRAASAATATGYASVHQTELQAFLGEALR